MLRNKLIVLVALVASLTLPVVTRAQGFYAVDYFDNANNSNLPDGTVHITNVGLIPGTGTGVGDLCALLYVFSADQQLAECCGCRITPNGLLKLSVNNNLTNNSLTGVTVTTGTIVMVPSLAPNTTGVAPAGSSAGCDPGLPPVQTAASFVIEGWSTHIQDNGSVTEGNFIAGINNTALNGYFSTLEVAALVGKCRLSNELGGSGHGLCNCQMGSDPPPPSILPSSLTPSTPTPTTPTLNAPQLSASTSTSPRPIAPKLSASTKTPRTASTQR